MPPHKVQVGLCGDLLDLRVYECDVLRRICTAYTTHVICGNDPRSKVVRTADAHGMVIITVGSLMHACMASIVSPNEFPQFTQHSTET